MHDKSFQDRSVQYKFFCDVLFFLPGLDTLTDRILSLASHDFILIFTP